MADFGEDLLDRALSSHGERKRNRDVEKKQAQEAKDTIRRERELNPSYFGQPQQGQQEAQTASKKRKFEFGDAGSSWRMMKLRRVYEIAESEGRKVEDVAMERYGSMEDFNEAKDEKEFIDGRSKRGGSGRDGDRDRRDHGSHQRERYIRQGEFKRPQERGSQSDDVDEFGRTRRPDTKGNGVEQRGSERNQDKGKGKEPEQDKERDKGKGNATFSIPTIPTPTAADYDESDGPILSVEELNKMNSKLLKAKLMGMAEDPELRARYEREKSRAENAAPRGGQNNTIVVSSINSRGELQDIGSGQQEKVLPGNRKKKPDTQSQTEHERSVQELLLQEKMSSSNEYDATFAKRIAGDLTFKGDLDQMDDRADEYARRAPVSDYKKSQHAINDYKRSESAMQKCPYCWQDQKPPQVEVLASGTRVYLALPSVVQMVPDHTIIVPHQHVLTSLECDDDVWDEINNFMKCMIRMQWEKDHGVIFMEQVINFKWHKHTIIDCIPVPMDKFEDAPAYFKEAINSVEDEWSQHRKVIDTSKNGFRRSMVKNLPYFHVWFEPKKGMGHVIEDEKEWEEWFGREVLGSMMEIPPDKWRRPKRVDKSVAASRASDFVKRFAKFDWTKML
ncbi:hypothetical protein HDU76_001388 [Blyttiomyces sp. JEL0837]|nr:hypothetical protein HDU76_001388 [Blyttiomyces sp. JEL0837]